jgi:hypothetical protein
MPANLGTNENGPSVVISSMRIRTDMFKLSMLVLGAIALGPWMAHAQTSSISSIHIYHDVAVAWHTDLPSDSIVFFSMLPLHSDIIDTTGYQHGETLATSTEHVVHLHGLISDTTYYDLIVSRTPEGIPVYIARSRFTLP